MPETMCVVFLFPKKKNIFLWKNIFSHFALLYGSARVEPDHENHQFSWKTMIFIDFHWFWSKIMKIDGFRCSWTSPASGIRSETVCVAFLNRWEKNIFSWKNIFLHFALLYGYAQSAPGHQNHQFSWKSMVFIDFHWFWSNWWFWWPRAALSIAVE